MSSIEAPMTSYVSQMLVPSLSRSISYNGPLFSFPLLSNRCPEVTPNLREEHFGQTLGLRAQALDNLDPDCAMGPPDLVHSGKSFGSQSSQYHENDFVIDHSKHERKDDDYYIGYYHYVNGLAINSCEVIEGYILNKFGIEKKGHDYFLKSPGIQLTKREMTVTYCTYNLFSKSDFRAKYMIQPLGTSKKSPVRVDVSYQLLSYQPPEYRNKKNFNFSSTNISDLNVGYWNEIIVSDIVRYFSHLDDPSKQVTGLVSCSYYLSTKESLVSCIKILVRFLPKGHLTGVKPSVGIPTSVGEKDDKVSYYKNYLVDALVRLCEIDASGDACEIAINEIKRLYYNNENSCSWDYVILRVLKVQSGENREKDFINLVHKHLKGNLYSTQLALILIEQVKFLLTKDSYDMALLIAEKCVKILPLDFDSWFYLTLCYILVGKYNKALLAMNSIPIVLYNRWKMKDADFVSGVKDLYVSTFAYRLNSGEEVISESTFYDFFPNPKELSLDVNPKGAASPVEKGSIRKLWYELFLFNPHLRHPMSGHQFYQSPLINCSPRELASVDPGLIKICGPNSTKNLLASQSSDLPSTSLIDYERSSTWGRCFDLISFFVAVYGWDNLVQLKTKVFTNYINEDPKVPFVVDRRSRKQGAVMCEGWLDQMFVLIYDDLRLLMNLTKNNIDSKHSALEWEIIGLLGWSSKYNLRESISSLITSVAGTSQSGGFDYFGTVKLLEIYDEFILSDICDSKIDIFHDEYTSSFFGNKLILKLKSDIFTSFAKSLEEQYLTLDFILLNLMKLISWNVRWYQYTPNYLVTKILRKLCIKHDPLFLRGKLRIVFEQNKNTKSNHKQNKYSLLSLFYSTEKNTVENFEFVEEDTILLYVDRTIEWLEELKTRIS